MNHWKPTYHFMPPQYWMNDPNGPIQINGVYHLFYQCNPNGDHWGTIHWGHARSTDLVHWEHLPLALAPSTELGEQHCFSGCCTMFDGRPVIFYTSVGEGNRDALGGAEQWIALGSDDLLTWRKPDENPVMTLAIHGEQMILDWRDPFVWQDGNTWYMVLGGSKADRGCVLLYRARSAGKWEYLGVLAEGSERVWECPNFFHLAGRDVLIYSPIGGDGRVKYRVGRLIDGKLSPGTIGVFDYGGRMGYYAPASFLDEQGRRIVHGWLPEDSRDRYGRALGWNGALALPRVISLDTQGQMTFDPVPELNVLRATQETIEDRVIGDPIELSTKGRALELEAAIEWKDPAAVLKVGFFASPDGEQRTVLHLDPSAGEAILDRRLSTEIAEMDRTTVEMAMPALDNGRLRLRLFIDHSTVEVFLNSSRCLTARVYPNRLDSEGIFLASADPGAVSIHSLHCWTLK
jgi:beta-fructofuranosidase